MKVFLQLVLALGVLLPSSRAEALGREFMTSVTYGVLAGTLVGTASLALSDNPGDDLNRIAIGASLGLYAGIILGLYVTYGVSEAAEEFDEEARYELKPPSWAVVPLGRQEKIEGAMALWQVHRF